MSRHSSVICALDTSDLFEAVTLVKRLSPYVGAFKIGHALTLPHGLHVIGKLQDAGATKIFLDLKFHDIPHVVGLAVAEAARYGAWMTTMHTSGGPEMMGEAVRSISHLAPDQRPILLGVSVLTSLSEETLNGKLGVSRSLPVHMAGLARLGVESGLDGLVCSPHEISLLRTELGPDPAIVVPGIRAAGADTQDQNRVASAQDALESGATYLVIGRPLTGAADPEAALMALGL
jgi:orotidine-5'-phosphate decarboxylase